MKKLLLFISILIFCSQAKAQMWCPPGATWHYRVYANMFPYYDGHLKLVVTNTVTLNSITCQNMVGTYYGQTMCATCPTTTINNFINVQTYESNGVTYIYNSGSLAFDTITNFNANIGDKWLQIRYPFNLCANNPVRKAVTVIDTGHVVINSINLKRVKISVPVQYSAGTYTVNVIEKISSLSGFLFHSIYNNCVTDGPSYGNFGCYSDDNFPLYNPTSSICAYVPSGVGVNENSITNSILKLYPNPTNGIFNVELNEPLSLKIYSATSALVYEKDFSEAGNFRLDISHLSGGIYYLKAETDHGASYSKLIKN
ncbi:MAG: T9SS type A sorting domain-containing protein [Bacteroidetes bacterium]|nr:T9SS type A sorting domain-containing protein [Bacteroidota bacterium]